MACIDIVALMAASLSSDSIACRASSEPVLGVDAIGALGFSETSWVVIYFLFRATQVCVLLLQIFHTQAGECERVFLPTVVLSFAVFLSGGGGVHFITGLFAEVFELLPQQQNKLTGDNRLGLTSCVWS
jgi:hypothetical protein